MSATERFRNTFTFDHEKESICVNYFHVCLRFQIHEFYIIGIKKFSILSLIRYDDFFSFFNNQQLIRLTLAVVE